MENAFGFGENWLKFLSVVDETHIEEATQSVRALLGVTDLKGKRLLDIGCGSGLFSFAARRLGARVHSFDVDVQSVECARQLRARYCPEDPEWTIERGSALDPAYLQSLGTFDVVYAWGVLHHTGALWTALANVQATVAEGGLLCVAIYNRQPVMSAYWTRVKRVYNRAPGPVQAVMGGGFAAFFTSAGFLADALQGRNPLQRHRRVRRRGMSKYRDVVDWIGGWPFEVATPGEVFRACRDAGFVLQDLRTCGGRHGCNEFVFVRSSVAGGTPSP